MATLISLYKDNRITSSEIESKDIDIVLGFLFKIEKCSSPIGDGNSYPNLETVTFGNKVNYY